MSRLYSIEIRVCSSKKSLNSYFHGIKSKNQFQTIIQYNIIKILSPYNIINIIMFAVIYYTIRRIEEINKFTIFLKSLKF
jgi:hypothetical protein